MHSEFKQGFTRNKNFMFQYAIKKFHIFAGKVDPVLSLVLL